MLIVLFAIVPFAVFGFSLTGLIIYSVHKQDKQKKEMQKRQEEYKYKCKITQEEVHKRYLQEQEERRTRKKKLCDYVIGLANKEFEITPEQFFKLKERCNYNNISTPNLIGVYILCNKTKNLFYVGQAHNLFKRISTHFTGYGNGDVYADYKYGDQFTIQLIKLEQSGFTTLNQLERATIIAYNAYNMGYNKTRGNM